MCEEATEVETHHQQTAATTMGVAEDETPSSLTSSHPNTNNPNQEGKSACLYIYDVQKAVQVRFGQLITRASYF